MTSKAEAIKILKEVIKNKDAKITEREEWCIVLNKMIGRVEAEGKAVAYIK